MKTVECEGCSESLKVDDESKLSEDGYFCSDDCEIQYLVNKYGGMSFM